MEKPTFKDFLKDSAERSVLLRRCQVAERERDALKSAGLFRPDTPLWNAFHRAWTASVGQPGYDKAAWLAIERELNRATAGLPPAPGGQGEAADKNTKGAE